MPLNPDAIDVASTPPPGTRPADEATAVHEARVPAHVTFVFRGFRDTERPADGVTLAATGRLACGRNSRAARRAGAPSSDVCLRAYYADGQLDTPATMAISRHHFDLVVVDDRLCLQARTRGCLQVNDRTVASGEVLALLPGDRIVPIPGRPDTLSLLVAFTPASGVVERVELSRVPAAG